MKSIQEYNENLGTGILLIGPPGGGKTVLGCRLFDKTYVSITDPNFASAKRYLERQGKISNIVGIDTVFHENGKRVPVGEWYDRFMKLTSPVTDDPNVDCLFFDSATFLEPIFISRIAGVTDERFLRMPAGKDSFDKWGQLFTMWKGIIMQIRQTGKKIIMACHEKKDKDESDGIYKYQVMLDGQIREKITGLFSDVWRCEVEELPGQGHRWMVRTIGNVRHELKSNYDLPAFLTQDDLVKRVREQTYKTAV